MKTRLPGFCGYSLVTIPETLSTIPAGKGWSAAFTRLSVVFLALLVCLVALPGRAAGAVFDDFESYAIGSNLHGQDGWAGWTGNASAGALVSSNFAFSGSQSVNITDASDLTHSFSGATNGQWVFSVMQYIPSTSTGTNYVILMNTYRPPYGTNDLNWSLQIQCNLETNQIISDYGGGATLPMVKDQWVEFRFQIDLAANSVSEFYNGQLLSTHAWQGGIGGLGLNEIQALDLFANNSGPVYYDNVSLGRPLLVTGATNKTVEWDTFWTFDPPTIIGPCNDTNVTITVLSTQTNNMLCPTVITRTWQIRDACTNVVTSSQTVTVEETTLPKLTISTAGQQLLLSWNERGQLQYTPALFPGSVWYSLAATSPLLIYPTNAMVFYRLCQTNAPPCCPQDIKLYNNSPSATFYGVHVVPDVGTEILYASIDYPWQQSLVAGVVEWRLISGPLPNGLPIDNHAKIYIDNTFGGPAKGVTIEWLDALTNVVCTQHMTTVCGSLNEQFDFPESEGVVTNCEFVAATRESFKLETEDDECTVDAIIAQISHTSCFVFSFANIVADENVADNPGVVISSVWKVQKADQLIGLFYTDDPSAGVLIDANGNAVVTVVGPGNYRVVLTVSCPDDDDDDYFYFTVDPISAAFTAKQTPCFPLIIEFQSSSPASGLTYEWTLFDLSGAVIPPDPYSTSASFSHSYLAFPGASQSYKVRLKVTNADGCTDTVENNITFIADCTADIGWSYFGCSGNAPAVQFKNMTTAGKCPFTYNWTFGDGTSSTTENPSHTFPGTGFGNFNVHLTVTDADNHSCDKQQLVTIAPCSSNYTNKICCDGTVEFTTSEPNPQWQFPGGDPATSSKGSVKVTYDIGVHPFTLTTSNANHCICTASGSVTISEIQCCAINDRCLKRWEFSYQPSGKKNKHYKMLGKMVVRNEHNHFIKSKAKLKIQWLGIYWRTKADEIRAYWSGPIYRSDGSCECCGSVENASDDTDRYNKSVAKHKKDFSQSFTVRKETITANFYVKVDSNHAGEAHSFLFTNDCDTRNKEFDPFECFEW